MEYIETERLILREWTLNDVPDQVEGLSNFETAKNLTTPFPYTAENSAEYILKHLQNNDQSHAFAVQLKDTKKVIGGTSLDFKNGKYSAGIWVNEKYTGKGYGTEIYLAIDKLAFDDLNAEEIENGYFKSNTRSQHLHEKMGYVPYGERTCFCPALNQEVAEVRAKLTKMDFYRALKSPKLKAIYNKIKFANTKSGRFH